MLPNVTDSLHLIKDRTWYEQPLPIHLNIPHYDNSLNYRPTRLRDFMTNYVNNNKEIFDLQQWHAMESPTFSSSKNFLFQSDFKYIYIYLFYNLNNNNNVSHLFILQTQTHRTIIASLILHKTKEV